MNPLKERSLGSGLSTSLILMTKISFHCPVIYFMQLEQGLELNSKKVKAARHIKTEIPTLSKIR
jgi:hypothetical protein